jgi:AraC-like DNA-binding protein
MSAQEEGRAAILAGLRAGKTVKEIVDFTGASERTVFRIKKAFKESDGTMTSARKKQRRRSDAKDDTFVRKVKKAVDADPGRSMRSIAADLGVHEKTVRRTVTEQLGYTSFALRRGQFMTAATKERRLAKAKRLLSRLKHPKAANPLIFFSDEKNFNQDQKVNRQNDRWLCADSANVPRVMSTKFPAHIMVLGVVSSEGHVMPPHFFEKGLKVTADVYIDVLERVVVPWMRAVANGRHFIFQQDSAPAHAAKKTQEWLKKNVPEFWEKDVWPPSSPDCNPLDYFVWGVCERDVNRRPHNTIASVKSKIAQIMGEMDPDAVRRACSKFRARIEAVIKNAGDFFE